MYHRPDHGEFCGPRKLLFPYSEGNGTEQESGCLQAQRVKGRKESSGGSTPSVRWGMMAAGMGRS